MRLPSPAIVWPGAVALCVGCETCDVGMSAPVDGSEGPVMVCGAMVEATLAAVEKGGLTVDCGNGSKVDEDGAGSTDSSIGAAAGAAVGVDASVGAG